MASIKQIQIRVQSSMPEEIIVTSYCFSKAEFRRLDLNQVKNNLLSRQDGFWQFSEHKGEKGVRIVVFFNVSKKKSHKYVLEVNKYHLFNKCHSF